MSVLTWMRFGSHPVPDSACMYGLLIRNNDYCEKNDSRSSSLLLLLLLLLLYRSETFYGIKSLDSRNEKGQRGGIESSPHDAGGHDKDEDDHVSFCICIHVGISLGDIDVFHLWWRPEWIRSRQDNMYRDNEQRRRNLHLVVVRSVARRLYHQQYGYPSPWSKPGVNVGACAGSTDSTVAARTRFDVAAVVVLAVGPYDVDNARVPGSFTVAREWPCLANVEPTHLYGVIGVPAEETARETAPCKQADCPPLEPLESWIVVVF